MQAIANRLWGAAGRGRGRAALGAAIAGLSVFWSLLPTTSLGRGVGVGADWDGAIHDSPSNYEAFSGAAPPNRGSGLEKWTLTVAEGGKAGMFLEPNTPQGGGVVAEGAGPVFGLFSNPPQDEASISAERRFKRDIEPGEVLFMTLWMNWGGGWSTSSKGVELIDGSGKALIRIVQRETSDIFIGRHVAICPQGEAPIRVEIKAQGPSQLELRAWQDGGDEFVRTFPITSAPRGLRFFSNHLLADNHEKRQLYFGDIFVTGVRSGEWHFAEEGEPRRERLPGAVTTMPGKGWGTFLWFGLVGACLGWTAWRWGIGCGGWCFAGIFITMGVLLVLPVWEVTYLPMGDAGAHFRQVALYADWPANGAEYERHLRTPYLAGAVLGGTIAKVFGADIGYRTVLSISLLAFPLGCVLLLKILGLSRWMVWASFPFAWNYSHIWGFHGFTASVPAGMAMLCSAAYFASRKGCWWCLPLIALTSAATALSHAMGWAVFAVVAGAVVASASKGMRAGVMLAGLACVLAPGVVMVSGGGVGGGVGAEVLHILNREEGPLNISLERARLRVGELLSHSYGRPSTSLYAAVGAFLLLWPIIAGASISGPMRRFLPCCAVVLFFLLAPNWAFGVWIIYPRIGFLLLPAMYFAVAPGKTDGWRWFMVCGAALAVSGLALLENRDFVLSTKADGDHLSQIAKRIPPGKNVLLILERRGENMFGERGWQESGSLPPAWVHSGGWLQDMTKSNFFPDLIDHGSHFVMRRKGGGARGVLKPDNWAAHSWCPANLMTYDYFLVKTGGGMEYDYLGAESGRVVRLDKRGGWVLYGNLRIR